MTALRTQVRKTFSFDAAHQLPFHDGKCANEHGHTYTVTLVVSGERQPVDGRPDGGMVVDFGWLDASWRSIEHRLDHKDLNVTLAEFIPATTSEFIAEYLYGYFSGSLKSLAPERDDLTVDYVTVSETPKTSATFPAQ